jgi:PAS domain S-box-containing protein
VKSVTSTMKYRGDELFRTLSQELPVGVCIMQDRRFCYVNRTFPIAIGYAVDELVGKDSLEIVVPEDREMVKENTMKMLKGELRSPYQFRVTCKDGSIAWVIATVKSIQHHGKRAVLGNYMEITERKLMEEERSALLEEAPVEIVHTDLKGRITYVNKRFESESGYLRGEVIGKSGFELGWFPSDTLNFLAERMAARLEGSPAKHWETQFKCQDGRLIWIELEGRILERSGVPVGFQIIATNITERKQAEEALRQSEERYRTMLEEMEEGYYEVDAAGNFTFVNDAMSRILGYSRDELIGMNYKIYTPKEDVNPILQAYNRVYRTGESLKWFPMPEIKKDGTRIFAEDSVFPLWNEKGETIGFRGISRDITERRQAEEALKQSEQKYRTILEEMGDGYFETDVAGNFTFVNDAMIRLLGYSKEEIIGTNFRAFTPEEKVKTVFEAYNRMYRTGEPLCDLPTEIVRKDGQHRFAETTALPIRNDRGETIGFRGIRRDITARKQMEQALKESEERYRTILEEMEDSYFEVDLGGHLTFVNNSVCRDLGYSREELIGKSYKSFTVEEDIEPVFRVFNEVYRTTAPNKGFPWTTIRKDGTCGFAETSISLLRNGKAEIIGFRGVGRDISERKQAEAKLRQSEERYRALFDNSVAGTLVVDSETMKVLIGNQAAARVFGFSSAEEGIGTDILDFVPPEEKENALELIRKELFERDSRRTFDLHAVTKDGRTIWISATGARITHGDRLAGLLSFADITERKLAEERLRQSEENYRALFDSSVIGTIVVDAETMTVVMANRAAARMFGFRSAEELKSVDPSEFIHPEDKGEVLRLARKGLVEEDSHQTYDLRAMTKDGREIWVSATGARITHEGRFAGLISFADITEQKQQSDKLIMTDRLASLGELASGAAHELNNPLTSIIGFSQLLMEREVPDDIREDLKLINSEAQRAASVTRNLLTFGGKHAPVKEPNQINNIIDDVLRLRTHEHKANNIEIEKHLAADLPEVIVDYFQMQQVFMNIIINAEYFMRNAHNRGTLTIITKEQNDTVMIIFTDDGPGIPSENLRRIFDPFFTTKEPGKGTGLGLSICHGIVTEHGGRIYAKSHLGQGATIVVELPADARRPY